MQLTNDYYYFTKALDTETCNKIIKTGKENFGDATVGHGGIETTDKKIRTNEVAWSNEQWIYDLIWPYMQEANQESGWKYEIKGAETVQIGKYTEGGFYNFHQDGKSDNFGAYNVPEDQIKHGNIRKLSLCVILNDDYEGGGFEFVTLNKETSSIYTPTFNKLGSVMVFPSFMMHRVKPVPKGTRYSLVTWFVGPPFK